MKPKAWDTQILKPLRLMKCMQGCPFLVVRADAGTGARLVQVAQALMAEALDHEINRSASRDTCKTSRDSIKNSGSDHNFRL